jgi:PAS domain S-box-containing protein
MKEEKKSIRQFCQENKELRARLEDAENTLDAIRRGEVDAFVISAHPGEQVYVLNGVDYPYRVLLDTMNEGAVTLTLNGVAVYCNNSLLSMLKIPLNRLRGKHLRSFIAKQDQQVFDKLVKEGLRGSCKGEITLKRSDGALVPVLLSCKSLSLGDLKGISAIITNISERKQAEKELMKAFDEMEVRVRERTRDLQIETQKLEETNIALNVLLKRKAEDQTELEERILLNVEELIIPYIEKLKKYSGDEKKREVYLSILESNLKEITSSFSRKLSTTFLRLTPTEIQIANLVRLGKTNKEISGLLNSSPRTIEFHRENIRKKLGLAKEKMNLRSFLSSLH